MIGFKSCIIIIGLFLLSFTYKFFAKPVFFEFDITKRQSCSNYEVTTFNDPVRIGITSLLCASDSTKGYCGVYSDPCGLLVIGGLLVQGEVFNSTKRATSGKCIEADSIATDTWYYNDENARKGWVWAGVTSAAKGGCFLSTPN
ncbi:hypothetical protein F8M41_001184 [Gigaspora margarita]|uniref:Uncharacterized protein n=1 Tax=Gigaspora margarita TaxID=4874 RepID=A0A8H4A8A0_GIGMA|nr:hypothetical protein F8M41_001184 [Gigaspora margarita]